MKKKSNRVKTKVVQKNKNRNEETKENNKSIENKIYVATDQILNVRDD